MRWPWSKEVESAQRQAIEAAEDHAHSVRLRIETERQQERALKNVRVLRSELEANGFTVMMIEAWGGRAR